MLIEYRVQRLRNIIMSLFRYLFLIFCIFFIHACELFSGLQPQEHVENAKVFIIEGEWSSATIELKNALQIDPQLAEARWLLGSVYLKQSDGLSASKELLQTQMLGFAEPKLSTAILQALIIQREFQAVVEKTSNIDKNNPYADFEFSYKGAALLGLGKIDEAETAFNEALILNELSVDARLGFARIAFDRRHYDQTASYLEEAKNLNPLNVQVWNMLGQLSMINNEYDIAEANYAHAYSLDKYNIVSKIGYARVLLIQNKFDSAMEPIRAIESIFPNHPTARYLRAYIAYKNDDLDKSKELLLSVLKNIPSERYSLLLLSDIYYREGKIEQTIEYLGRFISIVPSHLPAIKLFAYLEMKEGNSERALEIMEQAITRFKDPQLYALLGSAYLDTGDIDKGSKLLEQAVELDPAAANIRTQLAMGHLVSGSTNQAIAELESALELNPDYIRADVLLVYSYLRDRNFDAALATAEIIKEKHPGNPLPFNLSGAAYLGLDNEASARRQFEEALQNQPEYLPAHMNLARLDLQGGNIEAAERRFQRILDIDENNVDALINVARLEQQKGNENEMYGLLEKARIYNRTAIAPRLLLARYFYQKRDAKNMLDVMNEAKALNQNNPSILLMLGKAERLNGLNERALNTFKSVVEYIPNSNTALYELGITQLLTGDVVAGKESIGKVLERKPDHYQALVTSINMAINEKHHHDARSYLEKIKITYPDSKEIHRLEGDIYYAEGKSPEAILAYERAAELDENRITVIKLASAYQANNNNEKRRSLLKDWSNAHPEDIQINLILAQEYINDHDDGKAIAIYNRMLDQDPNNAEALNNLAWVYFGLNDPRTLGFAEKAYKVNPGRAEILDTYGWILIKKGQIEKGYELVKIALTKMPKSPDIIYHNTFALAAVGDELKAEKQLESLLEQYESFGSRDDAIELLDSLK